MCTINNGVLQAGEEPPGHRGLLKRGAGLRLCSDCVIIWLGHTAALCKWGEQCTTMEINSSLVCGWKEENAPSAERRTAAYIATITKKQTTLEISYAQ